MVKVIVINTAGDLFKAVRTLNRIRNKIPQMTREVMKKWAKNWFDAIAILGLIGLLILVNQFTTCVGDIPG